MVTPEDCEMRNDLEKKTQYKKKPNGVMEEYSPLHTPFYSSFLTALENSWAGAFASHVSGKGQNNRNRSNVDNAIRMFSGRNYIRPAIRIQLNENFP